MSKTKEENSIPAENLAEPAKANTPAFLKELQDKGTVTLKAKSRDELTDMVSQIPSDCNYGAGAVGFNHDTCEYILTLDIINK